MSKVVFQEELGGSTTIQAQDTAGTFTLQLPAADGTLVHSDTGGTATFDNLSLTGAVIAGAWDADTIDVEHGGTGATTLTGYVIASGTSPMTASATIPSTNITGLGTMSVQDADDVNITGGTADGLALGGATPAAATVTTLRVNSTVSLAGETGALGQVLTSNGAAAPTWENVAGTGDVIGPASATDNALVRFDDTTGKLVQNSVVLIGDTGSVTGVNALTAESLTVNNNAVLGSSNTDTLAVNARITTDLNPNVDNAKDIGTSGRNWRDGFFGRTLHTVNLDLTGTTSFDGEQGTSGQVLTSAGTGSTPTWTTPTTGTVTSVGGAGTVNGLTLTGTVTTSGDLTLGGTLDLSAPPAIGDATPAAGTFTTVTDQYGKIRAVPQSGSAKTTSYTLLSTDNGQFIEVGTGGSITIPDATLATGDVVSIFNNTSGDITITCTITTAYIGGTDEDKATVTLATRGVATILFVSGTVCVISGNVT